MSGSSKKAFTIGVVAPGSRIAPEVEPRVQAIVQDLFEDRVIVTFDPECFAKAGHFSGTDETRMASLERVGNSPNVDAVWFARGGYGACRIAETAVARLEDQARRKKWLGYSDTGFLLAGLYKAGFKQLAHGPMPADVMREGGQIAIKRALRWLVDGETGGLEKGVTPGHPVAAFNLTTLSHLVGTPLEPDLSGHILMLEDVDEYMYRIDRAFFTVTSSLNIRKCAGIRLGRILDVRENDPPFDQDEEQIARYWCERSGIPYLGRADIGHDIENKIVPFS